MPIRACFRSPCRPAISSLVLAQLPRDGDDVSVSAQLIKQVEQAHATPFTDDEVAKARNQLLKDAELLFNDANATA